MRRKLLGTVLLVLVLAATGCHRATDDGTGVASATGSKAPGASSSHKPLSKEEREELARKYTQCMKEHGVSVHIAVGGDDSGSGSLQVDDGGDQPQGAPPDQETMKKAEEACRQYQPDAGDLPKPNPEELERSRQFARCMRENGVDMPDPDDQGRVTVSAGPGDAQVDPGSDAWKNAYEKCRQFQPGMAGTGQGK